MQNQEYIPTQGKQTNFRDSCPKPERLNIPIKDKYHGAPKFEINEEALENFANACNRTIMKMGDDNNQNQLKGLPLKGKIYRRFKKRHLLPGVLADKFEKSLKESLGKKSPFEKLEFIEKHCLLTPAEIKECLSLKTYYYYNPGDHATQPSYDTIGVTPEQYKAFFSIHFLAFMNNLSSDKKYSLSVEHAYGFDDSSCQALVLNGLTDFDTLSLSKQSFGLLVSGLFRQNDLQTCEDITSVIADYYNRPGSI